MSDNQNDRDYEIGYGKPPEANRFKKGKSGNPKGRPNASKNVGTMLEETFFRKISITEKGVLREVTMLEAIFRQVANGAVKGEMRHVDRFLKLLPLLQEAMHADQNDAQDVKQVDPHADRAVLEALADIFGSDPGDLFASVQGGIDDERPES